MIRHIKMNSELEIKLVKSQQAQEKLVGGLRAK
jgi:hypothetical protein